MHTPTRAVQQALRQLGACEDSIDSCASTLTLLRCDPYVYAHRERLDIELGEFSEQVLFTLSGLTSIDEVAAAGKNLRNTLESISRHYRERDRKACAVRVDGLRSTISRCLQWL